MLDVAADIVVLLPVLTLLELALGTLRRHSLRRLEPTFFLVARRLEPTLLSSSVLSSALDVVEVEDLFLVVVLVVGARRS